MIDRALRQVHGTQGVTASNINRENVDPNAGIDDHAEKNDTNEPAANNDNADDSMAALNMNQLNGSAENVNKDNVDSNIGNVQSVESNENESSTGSTLSDISTEKVNQENVGSDIATQQVHNAESSELIGAKQSLPKRAARRSTRLMAVDDDEAREEQNSSVESIEKPTKKNDVPAQPAKVGALVQRAKSVDSAQHGDENVNANGTQTTQAAQMEIDETDDRQTTQAVHMEIEQTADETVCLQIIFF